MPINWRRVRSRLESADADVKVRKRAIRFCDFLIVASEHKESEEREVVNDFFQSLHDQIDKSLTGVRRSPETDKLEKAIFVDKIKLSAYDAFAKWMQRRTTHVRKANQKGGHAAKSTKQKNSEERWIREARARILALKAKGGAHSKTRNSVANEVHRKWPNDGPPSVSSLRNLINEMVAADEISFVKR
jgi:hypothetical protein